MDDIMTALESIKEQGSFCAKREMELDDLQLEVESCSILKFPLKPQQIKTLIKHAKPAKFGKRDKTLLDKEIRDAWEIDKSTLKINNTKEWNQALKTTLELLKSDLGLTEDAVLKPSLHNLLIYEPGQFFEYHQDSEKLNNMVATLIVVLPSAHAGGTLMIDNQGDKKQFQSSRFSTDKLTVIAFYADCHHAVKKVTQGYRLTLTYNLTLEKSHKKFTPPTKTISYESVTKCLRNYFKDEASTKDTPSYQRNLPKQWVYLLDHSYTQKGLSWDHLKNGDTLRAQALQSAANTLDLEIYLALADIKETWDCEMDYNYDRYHRYNHSANEHGEPTELIVTETTLRHWINQENKPEKYNECHISNSQICWTKASNEFKPFESEYEGYMGNYGNTLDHWYHRAAIVLWRKQDHYAVLYNMDPQSVMSELFSLSEKKNEESHVRQIIYSLLPYWANHLKRLNENTSVSMIFKLALYINDAELASKMLESFDIQTLSPARTILIVSLQDLYGTQWCLDLFAKWTKLKDRRNSTSTCKDFSKIIKNLSKNTNHYQQLTDWLLEYQLQKMQETNISYEKIGTRADLIKSTTQRMKEVEDFAIACMTVNNSTIYNGFLNHMIAYPLLYPAIELVKLIDYFNTTLQKSNLKQWDYKKLFDYILNALKTEKSLGLRDKDNWSIQEKASCKCADCITLYEFLQSETLQKMRWPMGKDRRAHIHQTIDGLGIPVTHETEHTGSPHKLILIKTDKLYSQAIKRFSAIEQALLSLSNKELLTSPISPQDVC